MDPFQLRRLMALAALGVVILGIGIAVAASGGESEPSAGGGGQATGPTGLTGGTGGTGATGELGQFIDDADAICSDTQSEIAGLSAGSESSEPSAEDVASEAGLVDSQLSQIERLDAPRENDDVLTDYLDGLDAQGQALGDLELGLGNGDDATIETAQADLETARGQADDAAAEYGFGDCANGASSADVDVSDVAPPPAETTTPTDLGEAVEQATTPTTTPIEPPATTPTEPAPPTEEVPPDDGGSTGGGVGTGGVGGTGGGGGVSGGNSGGIGQ